ncbi:MAG TPA: hypothetical protein VE031_01970 [Chthoniobacterales bacterium]|nr:hypothetical protein [Chthoniobacterales bacterium]
MQRVLVCTIAVALAASASGQTHGTKQVKGLTYCIKHDIPTISVIGYHSVRTRDKLVLVHDWDPLSIACDERSPNRLADDSKFYPTSIHTMRGIVTFCPRCNADYWHCRGSSRRLTDADVHQITALATRQSQFCAPILHIFAVSSPKAAVIGGHEQRVGDIFTDIVLAKRHGKWAVEYPVSAHKVVAIGRSDL